MPWHCPACQTLIKRETDLLRPQVGVLYRCHVCRLELILDTVTNKLTVAPFPTEPPAPVKKSA